MCECSAAAAAAVGPWAIAHPVCRLCSLPESQREVTNRFFPVFSPALVADFPGARRNRVPKGPGMGVDWSNCTWRMGGPPPGIQHELNLGSPGRLLRAGLLLQTLEYHPPVPCFSMPPPELLDTIGLQQHHFCFHMSRSRARGMEHCLGDTMGGRVHRTTPVTTQTPAGTPRANEGAACAPRTLQPVSDDPFRSENARTNVETTAAFRRSGPCDEHDGAAPLSTQTATPPYASAQRCPGPTSRTHAISGCSPRDAHSAPWHEPCGAARRRTHTAGYFRGIDTHSVVAQMKHRPHGHPPSWSQGPRADSQRHKVPPRGRLPRTTRPGTPGSGAMLQGHGAVQRLPGAGHFRRGILPRGKFRISTWSGIPPHFFTVGAEYSAPLCDPQ